jgi:hypothetical protein
MSRLNPHIHSAIHHLPMKACRLRQMTLLAACFCGYAASVSAEDITVQVNNGQKMTLDWSLVEIQSDKFLWKLNPDDSDAASMPIESIESIRFPVTDEWREANQLFRSGLLTEAAEAFRNIAAQREANHYPIPGNYASLAELNLLECYNRLSDTEKVTEQYSKLQSMLKTLPKSRRTFSTEIQTIAAIKTEDWQHARELVAQFKDFEIEQDYFAGRIAESSGDDKAAYHAYVRTYSLYFSAKKHLAADALKRSIELIQSGRVEIRKDQLQVGLKLYADQFGTGILWPEASAEMLKILD